MRYEQRFGLADVVGLGGVRKSFQEAVQQFKEREIEQQLEMRRQGYDVAEVREGVWPNPHTITYRPLRPDDV